MIMFDKLYKKMISASVLGLVLLPVQSVQAMTVLTNPTDQLIDNLMATEAVDFSANIDFETKNKELDQPIKLHVDFDGAFDSQNNGQVDLGFWTTDQNGEFKQAGGSAKMTADTLYFTDNQTDWYFIENSISTLTSANSPQDTEEYKAGMQELFDQEVIEYQFETVDFINKKMTMRYSYQVNNDRLADYLLEQGAITQEQFDQERSSSDGQVSASGQFWVDTAEMLPVMLTLNVKANIDAETYTNFEASILFNSFNETVEIDAPSNAISIADYVPDQSTSLLISSLAETTSTVDSDGDGLTDSDELGSWSTNPFSSDSDADGYPDQTEVTNGYNPNGPGRLLIATM